ncbi:hypothetical protein DVK44_17550 [Streptomyces paludis]|uniref:Uncharacterized protein n=1 Tax=Streptomyces paludis TaxID=2282738 RepID=A0A345HR50_9ACTN|nr:hypothetical protein DVK44_17550 [Streptomyces paludis]
MPPQRSSSIGPDSSERDSSSEEPKPCSSPVEAYISEATACVQATIRREAPRWAWSTAASA